MSRRRKSSATEDLLALVSLLPWWAGVALGVVSYVFLHQVAGKPFIPPAARPGQMGAGVVQGLWSYLASVGQYVLPLLCLFAAGISAWRRKERRQLADDVVEGGAARLLDGMSWQQFERVVGEGFRLQGYRVAELGGGGADGGVDLVLTKEGEKFLVQCKQWRALKVGVSVVRELYGVMAARGATGGFVVSAGRFTDEATAFAEGRNLSLIDGPQLHALIRRVRDAERGTRAPERPAARVQPTERPAKPAAPSAPAAAAPTCPSCGMSMVQRTAKRGSNAGRDFWGCTGYPACRGTRPMA